MRHLVAQQKHFDCGVAALSMWCHIDYPDAYALAVAHVGKKLRRGITLLEMRQLAKLLSHPMVSVHFRTVDLEEHSGILGINWTHAPGGHWVVLMRGTIIDPAKAQVWNASEYVAAHGARVGTLLAEATDV